MNSLTSVNMIKPKRNTLKKIVNSYLTPRTWGIPIPIPRKGTVPLGLLIEQLSFFLAKNSHKTRYKKLNNLLLWFSKFIYFPDMDSIVVWALASNDKGEKTPYGFKEMDPESVKYINTIEKYADKDAQILDLGCNCGRHIHALYERGFSKFSGVDISKNALDKMAQWFPEAHSKTTLYNSSFQQFLVKCKDKEYDTVISHGATIELVSPTFNIIRHLTRVSKTYVIIIISEHDHAYPRFWELEFRRNNYECVLRNSSYIAKNNKGIIQSIYVMKRLSQ